MADDVRADEVIPQLKTEFKKAIIQAFDMPGAMAYQCADLVCRVLIEQLASLRVGFPARAAFDPAAIVADWQRGRSCRQIMRDHGVSKTTSYKYHPSNIGELATGGSAEVVSENESA